jgi:hypothetical protein
MVFGFTYMNMCFKLSLETNDKTGISNSPVPRYEKNVALWPSKNPYFMPKDRILAK